MNLYFSGYQDKINLASFFLCNLTLLEGDLVSQSKLFKFWPLGGALVKHFLHHLQSQLVLEKDQFVLCTKRPVSFTWN